MADFGNLVLTNAGKELDAKIKTGKILKFKNIQVGDGSLGAKNPEEQTKLINKKYDIPINNIRIRDNNIVVISFSISNFDDELTWTELGIIAEEPDTKSEVLFIYANAGDKPDYIMAKNGNSVVEKYINLELVVSNTENIEVTLDSSLVYVPRSDFDEFKDEITKNIEKDITDFEKELLEKYGNPEYIAKLNKENTFLNKQTFMNGIVGYLMGNADTATQLQVARKINNKLFDGTQDIEIISSGKDLPSGGVDGDLYIQYFDAEEE